MANQNKIAGRFFFKKTDNGNLIGEFSNNDPSSKISTESADLQPEIHNSGFIGTFHSTWQEAGKPFFAVLTISQKTNSKLFTLEWNRNNEPIFKGEGMLVDGVLIGDYHQVK